MLLSEELDDSKPVQESYQDYLMEVFDSLMSHLYQHFMCMHEQEIEKNVDYAAETAGMDIDQALSNRAFELADQWIYDNTDIGEICKKCYTEQLHPLECVDEIVIFVKDHSI